MTVSDDEIDAFIEANRGLMDDLAKLEEMEKLRAENAMLREVVEQCLHARQCNAPYGQTEKYPSVEQLKAALAFGGCSAT